MHEFRQIGPLRIASGSFLEVGAEICNGLKRRDQILLGFCNAHTAFLALRDEEYYRALQRFLLLNDGIGLDIAARILEGRSFYENLNGTDFVPRLLLMIDQPMRIFLLGAAPHVVSETANLISRSFPLHRVAGYHHGYFHDGDVPRIISYINDSGADMLLVAMGNPRQEQFIAEHADALRCRLLVGVGALFDFLSGSVPRAPHWVRRARMEWLFRLWREPRRLGGRYTFEMAWFLLIVASMRIGGAPRAGGPEQPAPIPTEAARSRTRSDAHSSGH
jgi:beta-1,4-glucosyltransferase